MDPAVAALLGASISGVVVLVASAVGPWVGYALERRRRTDDRVREFRLSQLDHTERALLLQLMLFEAMANRDVSRGKRLAAEAAELGAGDPLVIGDGDVLRTFVKAEAPLAARLRFGLLGGARAWITALDASREERTAIIDAKAVIHRAFDVQRERVIRGLPATVLSSTVASQVLAENPAVREFMDRWSEAGRDQGSLANAGEA